MIEFPPRSTINKRKFGEAVSQDWWYYDLRLSWRMRSYINGHAGVIVEHLSLMSLLLLSAAALLSSLLVDKRQLKNAKLYPNIFLSLAKDIIIMSLMSCQWREMLHTRRLVMDQPHPTFTCPLLSLSSLSPTLLASFAALFVVSPHHKLLPYFPPLQ